MILVILYRKGDFLKFIFCSLMNVKQTILFNNNNTNIIFFAIFPRVSVVIYIYITRYTCMKLMSTIFYFFKLKKKSSKYKPLIF